jgi:hypothetical protein
MDDCIVVLDCTYIGGGGPPRGGAQEPPEGGWRTREPPQTLTQQGAHKPQIQEGTQAQQAQHGSCIQAAKYNSNTPAVETLPTADVETGPKLRERR